MLQTTYLFQILLNNVWQQYRDEADYAYSAAENEKTEHLIMLWLY